MNEPTARATHATRSDRIGREVAALRAAGFPCELLRDEDGVTYHLRVALERSTDEGPQPFTAILTLDRDFPRSRPHAVVLARTRYLDEEEQPYEVAVHTPSPSLVAWNAGRSLTEVVREIHDAIHHEDLHMAVVEAPGLPARPAPQADTDRSTTAAHRPRLLRFLSCSLAAAAGALLAVLVLVGTWWLYDPCAADQRYVDEQRAAGDPASLRLAAERMDEMYARGNPRGRGSCAALRRNPAPLRAIYMEHGNQLAQGGDLAAARDAFAKVAYYGGVPEAARGIRAITDQLWNDAEQQARAGTPEGWDQAIRTLEQVQAIHAEAIRPTGEPMTPTLRIYEIRLAWGDQYYEQEVYAEALRQYDAAAALLPGPPFGQAVAERRQWAERSILLRTATNNQQWQELIVPLEQLAHQLGDVSATDPFGKSLGQWLYDAYVGYASSLLDRGDDHAEDALAPIAKALDPETDLGPRDAGAAARAVKERATEILRQRSPYQIAAPVWQSPAGFSALLEQHGLRPTANPDPINLLVLVPDRTLRPLLYDSSQTVVPMPSSVGDDAYALALPPGTYRLAVSERERDYNYVVLTIEQDAAYLVTVTRR